MITAAVVVLGLSVACLAVAFGLHVWRHPGRYR